MEHSIRKARTNAAAKIIALVLACACTLLLFAGCKGRSPERIAEDIGTVIDIIDVITETATPEPEITAEPTDAPDVTGKAEEATRVPTSEPTEQPRTAEPAATAEPTATPRPTSAPSPLDKDGSYYSKEDVALYIHLYGKLPSNFITKEDAKALGWSGSGSDKLEKYAPGKSIGGDYFGNYEKLLPTKSGRKYYECDIDTLGKVRGVKRIVFSNDGLIYYTEDHYETFTLLYGNP